MKLVKESTTSVLHHNHHCHHHHEFPATLQLVQVSASATVMHIEAKKKAAIRRIGGLEEIDIISGNIYKLLILRPKLNDKPENLFLILL